MTQTFDIRFARSAGLAGLFEEPANEYRWKGAGRLSIDASGISIAVKRGLLSLFSRTQAQRISPGNLLHVYREGSALRLEFSTRESRRAVLPIWVSDREAAAKIVTLLPTQESVEFEDEPGTKRSYRFDRKLVAVLVIGAGMLSAALVLQRNQTGGLSATRVEGSVQPAVPPATPASKVEPLESDLITDVGPPSPASGSVASRGAPEYGDSRYLDPTRIAAPSTSAPGDSAAADTSARAEQYSAASYENTTNAETIAAASVPPSRDIWRQQFLMFRAESNALHADYLYARDALGVRRLETIEAGWEQVSSRIVNTPLFMGGEFYALRELELAISRNWRDHLSLLAEARRRGGDPQLLALAEAHREFAERVEAQLNAFAP